MSAFGGLIFTNKGRNLQAKAQAGAQLNFTRIAIGDGELGGGSIADLNNLIHQTKSILITKLNVLVAGKAVVGGTFNNQDLIEGFYWKELGVFAQDPDLGEILYCYGNSGENAEYIPAGGGPDVVEKRVDVVTIVGNAANVTADIEQSLIFATMQDLEALALEVDAKETPTGAQAKATAAETAAKVYADAIFAALVGASPELLNTLDELSNALGDDPNFAATIMNALAGKIDKSLATAANDFLVASGPGAWVKKTLAEVKAILELGTAAYTASTAYATAAQGTKADNALPKAGGTMTGILTAQNNASYTTKQVRNITLSTADPSGGANGDIWIKYKP